MLAFKYAKYKHEIIYPQAIQPKLDGVRALFCRGRMQSRREEFWNPVVIQHVLGALAAVPDSWVLDGEFYIHGKALQHINSAIAVTRVEPSTVSIQIQYHIFDGFEMRNSDLPFKARWKQLTAMVLDLCDLSIVKLVKTEIVDNPLIAERRYSEFIRSDFEGLMYRDPQAGYGLVRDCGNKENRWKRILKRKEWQDEWFNVTGFSYGEGRNETTVGAIELIMPSGETFSAGTGLSDQDRFDILRRTPVRAHIKYERLSEDGRPLKPSVIELDYGEEES